MKKILTLANLIFLSIIIILISCLVFIYTNTQKTLRDIFRISDIYRIQNGLSIFLSETNRYPEGENLILGKGAAQVLCLPENLRTFKGFMQNKENCQGKILINQVPSAPAIGTPYIYNLIQDEKGRDNYTISFSLEKGVGKEFSKRQYCAQPDGIKIGICKLPK